MSSTLKAAALSLYLCPWCFVVTLLELFWLLRTPLISRNAAFADALQQHLLKLSPVESATFRASHQSLTPESILVKVKAYDQAHSRGSASRKCAEKVDKSLRILYQFLASIAIAIQSSPDVSSLIVGGLRFIVDVIISLLRKASRVVAKFWSVAVACGELCDLLQEIDGYDRRAFWLLSYFTGIWLWIWIVRPRSQGKR